MRVWTDWVLGKRWHLKAIDAIKAFFSTPEKPVSNSELMALAKADKEGYKELGQLAVTALEAEAGAAKVAA